MRRIAVSIALFLALASCGSDPRPQAGWPRIARLGLGPSSQGFWPHAVATSADGDRVAFIGQPSKGCGQVYVYEVATGSIECASPDALSRRESNAIQIAISPDGGHVAYTAWNGLKRTPPDEEFDSCERGGDERCFDVYVHDIDTRKTSVVSVTGDGRDTLESQNPSISWGGRFVAFSTQTGVFVADRDADSDGTFEEEGRSSVTLIARESSDPSISADGRLVASTRHRGATFEIVVIDRVTGTTTNVGEGVMPSMSGDGRFVAFGSSHSAGADVYVHDLEKKTTTPVSVAAPDAPSRQERNYQQIGPAPSISADGSFVAFTSGLPLTRETSPSSCPTAEGADQPEIYLRDLRSGTTVMVSAAPNGDCGNAGSYDPAVSNGGRVTVFTSFAGNLTDDPPADGLEVFLRIA